MNRNDWLKTFAGTSEQQTFTSPYVGMTSSCAIITSRIELLNLANDSIKTILFST
jgi:hypothetical protein